MFLLHGVKVPEMCYASRREKGGERERKRERQKDHQREGSREGRPGAGRGSCLEPTLQGEGHFRGQGWRPADSVGHSRVWRILCTPLSPGPAGRLSGVCPSGAQESSGFCRDLPPATGLWYSSSHSHMCLLPLCPPLCKADWVSQERVDVTWTEGQTAPSQETLSI